MVASGNKKQELTSIERAYRLRYNCCDFTNIAYAGGLAYEADRPSGKSVWCD